MDRANMIKISLASPTDLPPVLTLLDACGLSPTGLDDHINTALIVRRGETLVGSAALELYGDKAVLRSVAVAPEMRGKRLGRLLTHASLNLARQHNVREVYLQSDSASDFFSHWGFQPVAPAEIAPAVQQSAEFNNGYADDAQPMRLALV